MGASLTFRPLLSAALACGALILLSGCAHSQPQGPASQDIERTGLIPSGPPFALNLEQLFAWTPTSELAEPQNVSAVPLAARFVDPQTSLDTQVRVLYAPDGINNFGNYLTEQDRFNLYTFTHWSRIDVLNWFSGESTVNLPPRPWVEAAHRNGVKVIGTIFFAPVVYGGDPATVEALLERAPDGSFPAADRLIELASFYGFDGWLMNQEADLLEVRQGDEVARDPAKAERAAQTAADMRDFMAYLTARAPEDMEIHWYDSMLPDGRVIWQNELNEANVAFLQDGGTRTADAIFLNYWWNADRVARSVATAKAAGRSPYESYFGADLWPLRTNNQAAFRNREWLAKLFSADGTKGAGSIALFAPNFNFESFDEKPELRHSRFRDDPADHETFYNAESRLFGGDDVNVLRDDNASQTNGSAWQGLGRFVPAKSPLLTLPFTTHFNTGHGLSEFEQGSAVGGPWHDMARQDVQPQFLFGWEGDESFRAGFDFDSAFSGGSSLRFEAMDGRTGSAEFPLFLTQFDLAEDRHLSASCKSAGVGEAVVLLTISDGSERRIPLSCDGPGWSQVDRRIPAVRGAAITAIGLQLSTKADASTGAGNYAINLGGIAIN